MTNAELCWRPSWIKVEMVDGHLTWDDLPIEVRDLLKGKLVGLWGAASDAGAFESWPIDKQQALVLLLKRMQQKGLWHLVKQITNVYGEGGVGLQFLACLPPRR